MQSFICFSLILVVDQIPPVSSIYQGVAGIVEAIALFYKVRIIY